MLKLASSLVLSEVSKSYLTSELLVWQQNDDRDVARFGPVD